jgi:hypothetical protein
LSSYVGQSEKNVRELFANARRNAPAVICRQRECFCDVHLSFAVVFCVAP